MIIKLFRALEVEDCAGTYAAELKVAHKITFGSPQPKIP